MATLQTLSEKLPAFWSIAKEIASGLRAGIYTGWPPIIQVMEPIFEPGFIGQVESIIPGWQEIAMLNHGQTAKHTIIVLATCTNLPEYLQADTQTRMEIEWSAVLHDLDKKLARRDSAHPFRSAAIVSKIMPGLGFETKNGVTENDLQSWSDLVMASQREDDDQMVHDHTNLGEIVAGMNRCWGENTTAIRVLKTVLFHQSLPTLKDWTNPVLMTDEELCTSITLEDLEVLGPLMIADSDSWNIFDESREDYLIELRVSNADTCRRIRGCV